MLETSIFCHMLLKCIDGFNSTLFAYGQTSAGKTHTLLGSNNSPGVIIIVAQALFQQISSACKERKNDHSDAAIDMQFMVNCSYVEIYNEVCKDLLSKSNTALTVSDVPGKGSKVVGAKQVFLLNSSQYL